MESAARQFCERLTENTVQFGLSQYAVVPHPASRCVQACIGVHA